MVGRCDRQRQLAQRLRRCDSEQRQVAQRLRRGNGCAGATMPLSAGKSPNPTSNLVNEHKNGNFVLGRPEKESFGNQKRTKTSILCSKLPKMRVPKGKSAQKPRFCAREVGKLASGSVIAETLSVTVAFLQITAHASKMQMPHNQIISF